jgi:DNA (cytosine-5)-methyltransferase 1
MEYSTKSRTELLALCKERGLKGVSKHTKEELIQLLSPSLQFVDLFCGIGGFHQAISRVFPTALCVMACDSDSAAQQVYTTNYGISPVGDIRELDAASVPACSLVCGGFPCQAFSAAGKKRGFEDPRGTLFFDILKIIDARQPTTIFLENVANLLSINKGESFAQIQGELTNRGYKVSHAVLSPHQFGIPQSRERVYIVASKRDRFVFEPLMSRTTQCSLRSILDTGGHEYLDDAKYIMIDPKLVKTQPRSGLRFCGYIKGNLRKKGARENTEHLSRVHKQTCRIHHCDGTQPTLAASETSGRYHIYDGTGVRKLTLDECYRLMDFPTSFVKHANKGVAYKQIGNSVCVKVIEEIIREMLRQHIL